MGEPTAVIRLQQQQQQQGEAGYRWALKPDSRRKVRRRLPALAPPCGVKRSGREASGHPTARRYEERQFRTEAYVAALPQDIVQIFESTIL